MKALISNDDELNIEAEVFLPSQYTSHHLIIINSAPRVSKEFYSPIARHLSQRSFAVVTYDYPTQSASSQRLNWEQKPEMLGQRIFECVLQWCAKVYPKHTIHVIGHGCGANIVGFAESCDQIATLVSIGSGIYDAKATLKNGLFFYYLASKIGRQLSLLTRGHENIAMEKLSTLEALRNHRNSLRASVVSISKRKALSATAFKKFNGRLLTLAPHDDILPYSEKMEIIPTLCTAATQRTRHLYAEDIEDNYIGFFGVFTPRTNNILWDMIADWISDNTHFENPPFGKFDDREFPLVVITITDIDPTPKLLELYLATMKAVFQRGPVFLLIDLTHVHWADSRLPRAFNQWIRDNAELVKRHHRYTVYVAPNFFIRNFLTIFHALPFTSIIKPHQVFRSYQSGLTWLRNVVAEYKLNNKKG